VAAGLLADAWGAADTTWWLAAVGGGYAVIWLGWSLAAVRAALIAAHGSTGPGRRTLPRRCGHWCAVPRWSAA